MNSSRADYPITAANTGISPLRCASVEMTEFVVCEEQTTTEARLLVERFERCAGIGGVAGPSTAQVAKCATCSAQDDRVVVGWRFYAGPLALWICGGPDPGLLHPNEQECSSGTPVLPGLGCGRAVGA